MLGGPTSVLHQKYAKLGSVGQLWTVKMTAVISICRDYMLAVYSLIQR